VPSFAVFGFHLLGVLIAEFVVLLPHLVFFWAQAYREPFWILMIVKVVAAVIFLAEAVRFRKNWNLIVYVFQAWNILFLE